MIIKAFDDARVELKGGGRGDFIVTCEGKELWNKRRMGDQFPKDDAIVEMLRNL